MALEDKKVPENIEVSGDLAAAIKNSLREETLPCAAAFAIAKDRGLPPLEVGRAADVLGIHLSRCQLGLYGYPGHSKGWEAAGVKEKEAPAGFDEAAVAGRDADGRITCPVVWDLAERFGIARIQAGWLIDRLGIKLHGCQLGAF